MFDFLGPVGLFIVGIVLVVAALYNFRVKDKLAFWTHPKFKNVPGGIYMTIAAAVIVGLCFLGLSRCASAEESGELNYFSWAEMYVGLDRDNISDFCRDADPSVTKDKTTTSNLGFRLNLIEYKRKRLEYNFNGKFTHHSCALNQDKPTYNAPGIEMTLRYNFK